MKNESNKNGKDNHAARKLAKAKDAGAALRQNIRDAQAAQFTPGPWAVRRASAGRSSITGREYYDHVIEPLNINAERTGGVFSANACLIAAAPELLAALTALVNGTEAVYTAPIGGPLDAADRAVQNALQDARAAIAKAIGRGYSWD